MGDADLIQVLERRFVTELKVLVELMMLWRRGGLERTPHAERYVRQLARERIAAAGLLVRRLAAQGGEVEAELQMLGRLAEDLRAGEHSPPGPAQWLSPRAAAGYTAHRPHPVGPAYGTY